MRRTSQVRFDLRDCAPMTRAEEQRCATDYVRTKDPALGGRLVMANMRLVMAVARRYCRVNTAWRAIFGVTRERARQVESRLKVRLRRHLREELGEAVGSRHAAA